jgi:hypothetical protein
MLTTNQKGLLAEQAVIYECVRLGIGVAKPLDDERYDLILDVDSRLLRIQCKWAAEHGDVITVRLYSNRRGPDGMITKRYSSEDVDGSRRTASLRRPATSCPSPLRSTARFASGLDRR